MFRSVSFLLCAVLLTGSAVLARAENLVTNGSFEINGGVGYLDNNTTATGWTNAGVTDSRPNAFNFIIDANADLSPGGGFNSELGTIWVWGPQFSPDPSPNGFRGSGDGTYFLGGDGAYATGPVSQVVSGLTAGEQYELSFVWAAAQFTDVLDRPFQSGWKIQFGSEVTDTETVTVASRGFADWRAFSHVFTASSMVQTLTFLATGGPATVPPFSLLDSVVLKSTNTPPPVPEIDPASALSALAFCGGCLAWLDARRRSRVR